MVFNIPFNNISVISWRSDLLVAKKLGLFLKQVGYKECDISFIPCSGLSGVNLTGKIPEPIPFNNISVISWRSDLLVEETGVPRENH
jgi:translation elongation factor EF-1alpha